MTDVQAMSLLMRVMGYLQANSNDLAAQSVIHKAYIRIGKARVRRQQSRRAILQQAIDLANQLGLTLTAQRLEIGNQADLDYAENVLQSWFALTDKGNERREQYKILARLVQRAAQLSASEQVNNT